MVFAWFVHRITFIVFMPSSSNGFHNIWSNLEKSNAINLVPLIVSVQASITMSQGSVFID